MVRNVQTLELSKRHQLIDLNNDKVNFELKFNIVAQNSSVFHVVIMTQAEVDNYDNLEDIDMRVAPGKISGSISSKENKYDNYILILRSGSEDPVHVEVIIDLEDAEPEVEKEKAVEEYPSYESSSSSNTESPSNGKAPLWRSTWFWVVVVVGVLLFSYFVFNYISVRRNNALKDTKISITANNSAEETAIPVEDVAMYEDPKKSSIYNTLKDIANATTE